METKPTIIVTDKFPKQQSTVRETFSDHGNEVEEIISARLPVIVRWGTLYFFAILLFIATICWFIKYPDIVTASAKLTSINAPKPVITTISGKLIKLNIAENQMVKRNQVLGYLESTANHEEVLNLSAAIDSIQKRLAENSPESILPYFKAPYLQLGELQAPYQQFSQALLTFSSYLSNGFYLKKKQMLSVDKENLQKLHANLLEQKELKEQDLLLSQKTFNANQKMVDNKVISVLDFYTEKSSYLNKQLSLPQMKSEIISNETQQNEKQKEIAELNNMILQQRTIFLQALNTLKSQIDEWKKKYLLIAPIEGKISFASFIQENQQLQNNQTICFVNPENSHYFAQITVPQSNLGKVAVEQKVLLKFPSYPFQEYGAVKGKIEFISHISTDSGYFAKVMLVDGLKTSYNNQIQYRDGLKGQAEIITKDMRLLERFYFSIISQIKR